MLNQIVVVGRLTQDLEIKELENGVKVTYITLAVPRSFKNSEGVYETDFIPCTLWKGIAENTAAYCKKGDIVGVKGRVQSNDNQIEIVAEKLTFLSGSSSHKKSEGESDEH